MWPMRTSRSLFISLVITGLVIGLVETDVVQLKDSYLYAEPEKVSLILKKGDEVFVIESREKVIINEEVMTYKSVDMANKILIMKKTTLPFTAITAIELAAGNKSQKYGTKGCLYGGLVGAMAGVAITMPEEEYHYMIFTVPICTGIDAITFGIVGAGYGYTQKINEQTFELGPNDWRIANE